MAKVLKADSVQLSFDGRKILQGIYLECKTGEAVGILGRNGCGKSSLLKIIFGSLTPQYKHISIDGEYISKGYQNNRIAYLPQFNYLPQRLPINQLARHIVADSDWNEFASHGAFKKHGHKKAVDLSGGELRQLETLIILYSKADFILLDEPFTHLSPVQGDEFKEIIRHRAKVRGIILTDHQYYNILEVSDRLVLLHNGYTQQITQPGKLVTYGYLSGK